MSRGRIWRPGCEPLPAREVAAAVGDTSVAPRADGPQSLSFAESTGSGSTRSVNGEGLEWSTDEMLVFAVSFKPLWEAAESEERRINAAFMPSAGRKRLHSIFEAHLFAIAAKVTGGYRAADRTLSDPVLWERLARAVERAYPDNPDRRLSSQPIRRHHYSWLRKHHLDEDAIAELMERLTEAPIEAIVHMGGLDPKAGSVTHMDTTHMDTTQMLTGDGTWIPARYKASERDCIEAARAGRQLRSDPDAVAYHDENSPGGSRGFPAVMGLWRSPHRQERVVTFADIKPRGKSDVTVFTEMTLQTKQTHPDLAKGLNGIAYDMALSSEDCDALLDGGIIPISKVRRTGGGNPSKANLGDRIFHLDSNPGQQTSIKVVAVDGAATITTVDSDGIAYFVPLSRVTNRERKHPYRCTFYIDYAVPDHLLVLPHLREATTSIRHNSTPEEREMTPNRRRPRALRIVSEADPDFDSLYGLREDSESNNSQYKQTLHHGRARTVGANNLRLDRLAYQCVTIITALVAHHCRVNSSLKGWFGDSPPPYRGDPTG